MGWPSTRRRFGPSSCARTPTTHGVRVKLEALLSTARITTTLGFSFGDPHRSVVIELPELLGTGSIRLASYPPELTLAEKIATMMSRRELNTRDRDFADV